MARTAPHTRCGVKVLSILDRGICERAALIDMSPFIDVKDEACTNVESYHVPYVDGDDLMGLDNPIGTLVGALLRGIRWHFVRRP